jgi:hypothetical protein
VDTIQGCLQIVHYLGQLYDILLFFFLQLQVSEVLLQVLEMENHVRFATDLVLFNADGDVFLGLQNFETNVGFAAVLRDFLQDCVQLLRLLLGAENWGVLFIFDLCLF